MGTTLATTVIATLLALTAPGPVRADPPPSDGASVAVSCLDRSIDAVQQRYEKVRDFSARFVQTSQPAHVGSIPSEPVVSRGRVVVAKPARMRWVYEPPNESIVVSDGTTLWIYDPAFGEAQRLPVAEGYFSGAAVQFLLGQGDMRREFEISATRCSAESAELLLVPRKSATYERLHIVLDPRSGDLSETRVQDLLGNVTLIAFSDLETDTDPPASTFRFEAPEGVKVIDLEAPSAP